MCARASLSAVSLLPPVTLLLPAPPQRAQPLPRSAFPEVPCPQKLHELQESVSPMEKLTPSTLRVLGFLQPSPTFPWLCILALFLFGTFCSSQPLLKLGHKLVSAMDGSEETVALLGPQHQERLHVQSVPLAMKGSPESMERGHYQPPHQHLRVQTLNNSLAMEGAVAMSKSSTTGKKTHIDLQHQPALHPQTFFEVTTPIDPPPRFPCASLHIFKHSFANTLTRPPAMKNYTPPSLHACKEPSHWSHIILTWSGASVGRQYDRIAAVWFGGVELLRTCTAEPTKRGIVWKVKKDVTKYASIFAEPQPVVVELGNLVNDILTGVFHINLTLDFFSASHVQHRSIHEMPADFIIPISSPSPLPSGHWFQISNGSYFPQKSFSVPQNVYKAVLEVYLSFHGDDEFWYMNPPNEYITSNNLTGVPGNGAFREVQVYLDGQLVAAIWPFPVVYTGGIINLYWRPVAAIGAFNLPTYEFDLSPFVGALTDGKEHALGIRVENGIGNWFIDGCLHLWLDQMRERTSGKLISYNAPAYTAVLRSEFKGLNGTFVSVASRTFSYSGYVVSSMGNLSVSSSYALEFNNVLVYANNSDLQTVSQTIYSKRDIRKEAPSRVVLLQESSHFFPLNLSCLSYEGSNKSLVLNCNLSHAYDEKISTDLGSSSSLALLNNRQQGQGEIVIMNSTVVSGLAALQQQYSSQGGHRCYTRVLSTKNYTILYDSTNSSCAAIIS